MRVTLALPSRLVTAVTARLALRPPHAIDLQLHDLDSSLPLPPAQAGDGLLILQPLEMDLARQTAAAAAAAQIHYGEIALAESPPAQQYGFMLAVAGKSQDLHPLSPVINALAPTPYAWWHIGHAAAAAFLYRLQQQCAQISQQKIDLFNPLPQLSQLTEQQQLAGALASEYLALSEGEHFIAALPDRQHALASFLDGGDSPARQIARMICLLAKAAPPVAPAQ